MEHHMTAVLVIGLLMTAIALPLAARRVSWIYRLIASGQPAPDRVENVRQRTAAAVKTQFVEVLGQRKLLKWTVPGIAHFFVFWAFLILATVYLEAYGSLFQEGFAIPVVGHWGVLGFAQDFIAVMGLFGIIAFAVIRVKNSPARLGRGSRFQGSHLGGAWLTLFMIFNVIWTMFLFRGAGVATGNFPYGNAAFASHAAGRAIEPLGESVVTLLEHIGLLLHIGVMLVFLIFVLHSKHLHIFVAPINVMFGRRPIALGAAKELIVAGTPFSMEEIDELDEGASLGVGRAEDFTWKGLLDFTTCTECGRCQSQCPAWNTEKPLSPKLLIMGLRDHANAKAPYMQALAKVGGDREKVPAGVTAVPAYHGHPAPEGLSWDDVSLIGDTGYDGDSLAAYAPTGPGAIIDTDVLWSCTTCGACVEQCPVDIEHVDHIIDMRRYQTLIESAFPSELGGLFKNLEGKGNPWGMGARARLDWAKDLPFPVKVLGQDVEKASDVEWLFWVGCAGAYEDRAKQTSRAVAELLDIAGVTFAVLGNGETCTGDSARRAGNELLFQTLAQQNVDTFGEFGVTKVVVTCAHCFNTIKNEYAPLGGSYEVVHHTQLLNRLVRDKKLVPVALPSDVPGTSSAKNAASTAATVTYHDPCYLGRHNGVYAPPRELIESLPGVELREMERTRETSFCCGAGGARMWMEEKLGTQINTNRTEEAIATGAERIAIGCPFCRVMISDGLTAKQAEGEAESVEVVDVAQMLLAAVRRGTSPDGDASAVGEAEAKAGMPVAPGPEVTAPAPAPAAAATAAAAVSEPEADPWDEPAAPPAAATSTAPAVTEPEADPWDEPVSTGPDASAHEPVADADPWDEPVSTGPDASAHEPARDKIDQLVEVAPAADEPDPWDEPAAPAADASPQPASGAAPAPAAVEDSVDPWDEPADSQPAEAAPVMPAVEPDPERPSSDQLVDVGTVGDDEETAAAEEAPASDAVAPAPEQSEPGPAEEPKAAPTGFTGDAALLDEPDPWD
jgi:Fe-S oxidoreductase